MEPVAEPLTLYGQPGGHDLLSWEWAEARLDTAATYWLVAPSASHPHPRPVWGVWLDDALHMSVGSPVLRDACVPGASVTVHLDDGLEVVIVEGSVRGWTSDAEVVGAYDAKYSYEYDLAQYGPFTTVAPARVLAWRAAGEQGAGGFAEAARFRFRD